MIRYNRLKARKLKQEQWISSVETDGVAVSIIVKTPLKPSKPKKGQGEYNEEKMHKARELFKDDNVCVVGYYPGLVNILTGASILKKDISTEGEKGEVVSNSKYSVFSRSHWAKICR